MCTIPGMVEENTHTYIKNEPQVACYKAIVQFQEAANHEAARKWLN